MVFLYQQHFFFFFLQNTRPNLNISNSPLERSTFKTVLVLKKYDCHLELPRDRFQTLILILSEFKQINFHTPLPPFPSPLEPLENLVF